SHGSYVIKLKGTPGPGAARIVYLPRTTRVPGTAIEGSCMAGRHPDRPLEGLSVNLLKAAARGTIVA
ncbi:MAG TPA: hypothetical protein VEI25_07345, partial [Paraburkholderia sp.]|nr:hypothetical protein [Paraburkholderia sp.]